MQETIDSPRYRLEHLIAVYISSINKFDDFKRMKFFDIITNYAEKNNLNKWDYPKETEHRLIGISDHIETFSTFGLMIKNPTTIVNSSEKDVIAKRLEGMMEKVYLAIEQPMNKKFIDGIIITKNIMTIKECNEKINKLLGFDFGEIYIFTLYNKKFVDKILNRSELILGSREEKEIKINVTELQ